MQHVYPDVNFEIIVQHSCLLRRLYVLLMFRLSFSPVDERESYFHHARFTFAYLIEIRLSNDVKKDLELGLAKMSVFWLQLDYLKAGANSGRV